MFGRKILVRKEKPRPLGNMWQWKRPFDDGGEIRFTLYPSNALYASVWSKRSLDLLETGWLDNASVSKEGDVDNQQWMDSLLASARQKTERPANCSAGPTVSKEGYS